MNKVILMGRLTRDPEVRYSAGDNSTAVARYTLAVNRRFKRDNEPFFNPIRGILWKNNVCKLRAHFRTDDKNIKVLKSLKGVDITPEVPEE